jgi:AcrR family transcriptional regulator
MGTGRTMQRPGGRTARVRSAVHEAVIHLLEEHPWEEMSVSRIAERSGVHQATIYRRWGTMSALLSDVLIERFTTAGALPDTGSLRGDLLGYITEVAKSLEDGGIPLILRASVMEIRPGKPRQTLPAFQAREQQLQVMLDRAAARGEQVPTVEQVFEIAAAPLYFRALFTQPVPADEVDRLVDRLLTVLAAQSPLRD